MIDIHSIRYARADRTIFGFNVFERLNSFANFIYKKKKIQKKKW